MVDVPTNEEMANAIATLETKIAALGDNSALAAKVTALENQLSAFKLALKTLNDQFNPI